MAIKPVWAMEREPPPYALVVEATKSAVFLQAPSVEQKPILVSPWSSY
jgi:hypothetical protein